MIALITGTPGAGKTLYAISKLLRDLVGSTVKKHHDDGTVTEIPRRILTNIPGLLLDHELIGPDAPGGLADWFTWCKPGDVICYDEVQRSWTPRANGSKVPDYISALETHRHMGVDFILLTQNPMLIDRNVTALVGRHLHVRRFGGLGAAIVYEWDHASRSLMFSKSIAKHTFRYDKSVFKLYKSAELHTKPKTSIPTLAIVSLLALVGAAFAIPYAADRIGSHGEMVQKALDPASTRPDLPQAPQPSPPILQASTDQADPVLSPLPALFDGQPSPSFSGCALARQKCTCYDTTGAKVDDPPPGSCEALAGPTPRSLTISDTLAPPFGKTPQTLDPRDLHLIGFSTHRDTLPFIK